MKSLPLPQLASRTFADIPVLTDNALAQATGVRVVFSGRLGGSSLPPYDSLNIALHVEDEISTVEANTAHLLHAVGAQDFPLIRCNQVHGTNLVTLKSSAPAAFVQAQEEAREGADGVLVEVPQVAALMCFADCMPVALVSPRGSFAVVHAGWRGCVARIVSKALIQLAQSDGVKTSDITIYIGPHIGPCCFEVSEEIPAQFCDAFGSACVVDARHVSLEEAVRADVLAHGASLERIASAKVCTVCHSSEYFSYRASGGVCGRHGLLAFRAPSLKC